MVIDYIVSAGNKGNSSDLRRGFHNLTLNYMSVDKIFSSQLYRSNILRPNKTNNNSHLGAVRVKTASVLLLYYEKLRNILLTVKTTDAKKLTLQASKTAKAD